MSTLAGEFTSSRPKITADETYSAYLSFFSSSGPVPRPRISTDLRAGFFDSDLYLLSSYNPSTVPMTIQIIPPCLAITTNIQHLDNHEFIILVPDVIAVAVLSFDSAESPSEEASTMATSLA